MLERPQEPTPCCAQAVGTAGQGKATVPRTPGGPLAAHPVLAAREPGDPRSPQCLGQTSAHFISPESEAPTKSSSSTLLFVLGLKRSTILK